MPGICLLIVLVLPASSAALGDSPGGIDADVATALGFKPDCETVPPACALEIWFSTPVSAADAYSAFDAQSFVAGGPWDQIADLFDVQILHGERLQVASGTSGYTPDQLQATVTWMRRNDKRLAVGAFSWGGATVRGKPFCEGREIAMHDWGINFAADGTFGAPRAEGLAGVLRAGGNVDYLILDGPVSRLASGGRSADPSPLERACSLSYRAAVDSTIRYLSWMRDNFVLAEVPVPRFVLLVNFSNWTYDEMPGYRQRIGRKGWLHDRNYRDVLADLITAAAEKDVPIHGLMIDHPWDHFDAVDRRLAEERLTRLLRQAADLGLSSYLITNAEGRFSRLRKSLHWPAGRPFFNTVTPHKRGAPPDKSKRSVEHDRYYFEESIRFARYACTHQRDWRLSGISVHSWHTSPWQIFSQIVPTDPYCQACLLDSIASLPGLRRHPVDRSSESKPSFNDSDLRQCDRAPDP